MPSSDGALGDVGAGGEQDAVGRGAVPAGDAVDGLDHAVERDAVEKERRRRGVGLDLDHEVGALLSVARRGLGHADGRRAAGPGQAREVARERGAQLGSSRAALSVALPTLAPKRTRLLAWVWPEPKV